MALGAGAETPLPPTIDTVVARIRSYMDIGVQGLIVEMPASFDIETLR